MLKSLGKTLTLSYSIKNWAFFNIKELNNDIDETVLKINKLRESINEIVKELEDE